MVELLYNYASQKAVLRLPVGLVVSCVVGSCPGWQLSCWHLSHWQLSAWQLIKIWLQVLQVANSSPKTYFEHNACIC